MRGVRRGVLPGGTSDPPRTLAAPLHRHSGEDEYSYVLEGRMGALLGDAVVHADAGTLVFKPRHQWHTFWNAGDGPCRILEIISPGGFERLFEEAAEPREAAAGETPLDTRYGIESSTSRAWDVSAQSTVSSFRGSRE